MKVLTVADEILASLAFIKFVEKVEMFAVDTDIAKVEREPPRLFMFWTVSVLIFPCKEAVLNVERLEIYIVEKLPKVPRILLVVIDDATNDEVKSCEYALPSL